MPGFDPSAYGPVLASLVDVDHNRALDGGRPDAGQRRTLEEATLDTAFAHTKMVNRDMARACLAAAWLVHDFLDESHRISQEIETTTGSFWHGVMHRREGDFSNAKYWFRRVGNHAVLDALGPVAQRLGEELGQPALADRIAQGGNFDAFAMVDACQAALRSGGAAEAYCRRVQQAEWELLFDYCYRAAVD